jgi:DNA topoisomerase IB
MTSPMAVRLVDRFVAERIVDRFLAAKVAALPSRVDWSVVKTLVSDLKRLTKIYRDLPTKLDEDPETHEQSYGSKDQWEETDRLFNQFRNNLDAWVYKVLIQHSKVEKDSWAQKDVREKAWSLLGELSGSRLLPTAWNYKTNKHEIAPWELERKRDANIQRYQKRFRDFVVSLEALIQSEGGTVERRPETEQFSIAGMNVVVHAVDRTDTTYSEDFGYEPFLRDLARQAHEVARAGFRKAVEGLTVHLRFDEHGLTAGQYNPESDTLTIFTLGQGAGPKVTTFIHETGHRFYYRVMPSNAREHWDDVMKSHTVEITPQDVTSFISDVYNSEMTGRELEALVERSTNLDPEMKAKYRFLADHNPAYVATPEGVTEHHRKFNLGEKVNLEHITDYGATSPVEAFAEAFQLYVRKGPRAFGPWTRSFFERLTHSGRSAAIERIAARYKDKKKTDAGNTVYLYSERQIANRNKEKAERIQKLRGGIEKLRTKVKKDLKSKDQETARTALAVALMDHTYERVGNEESASEGHFGVTGWQRKHVSFSNGGATIKYVGKSGVKHEKKVTDASIRSALKDAYDSMEGEDTCLLEWKDGKVTAEKVNAYLEPFDITAKDIRGLHANEEMRTKLKAVRAKKKLPEDKKEREKQLKDEFKEALEQTAECVGHEPSTLKSQYLVPGLEDNYLKDGTIIDKLGAFFTIDEMRARGRAYLALHEDELGALVAVDGAFGSPG